MEKKMRNKKVSYCGRESVCERGLDEYKRKRMKKKKNKRNTNIRGFSTEKVLGEESRNVRIERGK
jgi:hypothetical protein